MSDTGVEDSAILMLAIGEDEAAEVFRHLGASEVAKLSEAMARLGSVSRNRLTNTLERFNGAADQTPAIDAGADTYVRAVLNKALGNDKARMLCDRILKNDRSSGIDGLKLMDAASIAELIGGEHPQIVASILAHLDRDQASAVIAALEESMQGQVIHRIATLDGIQPQAMRELDDALEKLVASGGRVKRSDVGGVRAAADILNHVGSNAEAIIIESLRASDPELAEKILEAMFIFDNILDIDDRGIQLLLREVQSESLVIALKGASEELRDKIFKNMSQRAADMMKEDLDAKGPVRLSDVEAEQKAILKTVRRLADDGQLMLGGKGDDGFV
ncbi:MAG: flagellar motor switch protein FliG [Burkholderiaceae bacterium]